MTWGKAWPFVVLWLTNTVMFDLYLMERQQLCGFAYKPGTYVLLAAAAPAIALISSFVWLGLGSEPFDCPAKEQLK